MNLFGILGNIGRVLPGYMQGYRMAIQDNWNDLNQYNQVQKGQLNNLYDEATFEPAVDMYNSNADMARLNLYNLGMQTQTNLAALPATLQQAATNGIYAAQVADLRNRANMQNYVNMLNGKFNIGMNQNGMLAAVMSILTPEQKAQLQGLLGGQQTQPSGVTQ